MLMKLTLDAAVLPQFQLLIEQSTVASLAMNEHEIKNYPPYSAIVQNLWPVITNTVILLNL